MSADDTDLADAPTRAGEAPAGTRDYIKALVLIAFIVGLVILVFLIGIGAFCGCTTRQAG